MWLAAQYPGIGGVLAVGLESLLPKAFLSFPKGTGCVAPSVVSFEEECFWVEQRDYRNSSHAKWIIHGSDGSAIAFSGPASYPVAIGVTRDFIVVLMQPFVQENRFSRLGGVVENGMSAFKFDAEARSLFFVLDRHHQCISSVFQQVAFYAPQGILQARQVDNGLLVDVLTFESAEAVIDYETMQNVRSSRPKRVPLGSLRTFSMMDLRVEAARFEGAAGMLNSFPWATSTLLCPAVGNALWNGTHYVCQSVRKDERGQSGIWYNSLVKLRPDGSGVDLLWTRDGCHVSSPVRIDDGKICSLIIDSLHHRAFLIMLSSRGEEICRISMPSDSVCPAELQMLWLNGQGHQPLLLNA